MDGTLNSEIAAALREIAQTTLESRAAEALLVAARQIEEDGRVIVGLRRQLTEARRLIR